MEFWILDAGCWILDAGYYKTASWYFVPWWRNEINNKKEIIRNKKVAIRLKN